MCRDEKNVSNIQTQLVLIYYDSAHLYFSVPVKPLLLWLWEYDDLLDDDDEPRVAAGLGL